MFWQLGSGNGLLDVIDTLKDAEKLNLVWRTYPNGSNH